MSYCDKMNCGYYYKDEDDDFPCCHFVGPDGTAPCEYDDEDDEVEDEYTLADLGANWY
jgi:hypothetical protein